MSEVLLAAFGGLGCDVVQGWYVGRAADLVPRVAGSACHRWRPPTGRPPRVPPAAGAAHVSAAGGLPLTAASRRRRTVVCPMCPPLPR